ncbi:MAG: ATP-binding protein, partial [Verrucomicrobiota bacterium]|nr:ATP-binding protein [Verrucomicrobiota bacterium]
RFKMWQFFCGISVALLFVLHFWWKRRYESVDSDLGRCRHRIEVLQEEHENVVAQTVAQQEALFNSMLEGFLLLDAEGRVKTMNQSLQRLFTVHGDIRGKTIMEAFRLHGLQDLAERVSREGQVRGFELELPGFRSRYFEVSAVALFDLHDEPNGMLFTFHDLTRLKELENTRKEFVANVSHELRTPLTLIKGFVETLIDGAKDDPAVATRFLQTIQKHTDRLTFLIEDLLTISRLESGQITLNQQKLLLRPLVERVMDDLQSRAAEKDILLENRVNDEASANVDADRLQQVLFNLVDNSIKYGRLEGTVIVGAEPMADGFIKMWVKDDGPGIPPDATERVFERFYRVDRARSREQGGTGLGLSIVKHIVQSHGGEVWVESRLGEGATFYFTLPVEKIERFPLPVLQTA